MSKILVVDDSALMRKQLCGMLEDAGYEVDTAHNGEEALRKIEQDRPDAITLDINMPVMDGLTCLSHIMTEMPLPVVMVSSLTEKGALATFEALEMGAIDYIAKPGGTVSLNIKEVEIELLNKIKAALRSRINTAHSLSDRLKTQRAQTAEKVIKKEPLRHSQSAVIDDDGVVVIGVSTGGPGTLEKILVQLPADFPWPIFVAQHMPAKFTSVFASRLDKLCAINIVELNRTTEIQPGTVYIARGEADAKLTLRKDKVFATNIPVKAEYTWHPSVEHLVKSAGELYEEPSIICVQLTGMGNDGAKAMKELYDKGARTIAESEASAVVFGMPQVLIELGGATKILDAEDIAQQLINWVYK